MKAAIYHKFQGPISIAQVADPIPGEDSVIIKVEATGICRSDWHGWMGHDTDVKLPHVPGHELAGVVVETGKQVKNWKKGDRVTVPFCVGCGACPTCKSGNQQICDNYFQPGFTAWGSFAELVNIRYADENLVRIPETLSFADAASLGCRFITSFRGIVDQGRIAEEEWIAIFGCGGVGLSAIMIAAAKEAIVIAIDIDDKKLELAKSLGANFTLNAAKIDQIPAAIKNVSQGGVHLSVDALGSRSTCRDALLSLRKRGRHIQIGLLAGKEAEPPIPMSKVISDELEIIGSHGMQAHRYPEMLDLITEGKLTPAKLVSQHLSLEAGAEMLVNMNNFPSTGIAIINQF